MDVNTFADSVLLPLSETEVVDEETVDRIRLTEEQND